VSESVAKIFGGLKGREKRYHRIGEERRERFFSVKSLEFL